MPLLTLLLPGAQVPAALSIGTMVNSVSRIAVFRKHVRWQVVAWFVPAAVPAVVLGAWLLTSINTLYLQVVMGLFLLSNIRMMFLSTHTLQEARPLSRTGLLAVGMAAGLISGLTGAVGVLFNRFYLQHGLSKEEIVATRAANEVLLHVIKLVMYISFGLLTHAAFTFGILIAVAAMMATLGVRWLLPVISEGLFRRVGYGAMVASGIFLFGSATAQVIAHDELAVRYGWLKRGITTQLQWRDQRFSLKLDREGVAFEHKVASS